MRGKREGAALNSQGCREDVRYGIHAAVDDRFLTLSADLDSRGLDGRKAASMQPRVDAASDVHTSSVTGSSEGSSQGDGLRDMRTPPGFERSRGSSMRLCSAVNDNDRDDAREHFVFPDPLSSVTDKGTTLPVAGPGKNTAVKDDIVAELCNSPRRSKFDKGKGIVREPVPSTNKQEKPFLPLLREDNSRFPNQPDHGKQKTVTRSKPPFHSKRANLNIRPTSSPDQQTLSELQIQSKLQSHHNKLLRLQTRNFVEVRKQLQRSTSRDIQTLQKSTRIHREVCKFLVSDCEGLKREVMGLRMAMAQVPQSVQWVGSRDGGIDGDRPRGEDNPALPFPPPPSSYHPPPAQPQFQQYASNGYNAYPYYPLLHPHPSIPQPTTPLDPNTILSTTSAPLQTHHHATTTTAKTAHPIAGPSTSIITQPTSHVTANPYVNVASIATQEEVCEYHRQNHFLQNPQGCRWAYCYFCRSG